MAIDHLLAVVPVSDVDTARGWYAALFGRDADNNPMPTLVEWRVRPDGWVQVFADPGRAGSGLLNFAVDDLARHLDEVRGRGVDTGPVEDANKGVQTATVTDPDGNTIRFIGGFRVEY
ncbi:VOC family protein [Mycobacterium sp. PS03-16]|uniref:VOC family protein n=1 Tax=Mycobacterium sp. PS03-16 TaxID=2559611 RepID=UPI0010749CA2|nr:VOC family protein [Mycobacterium sp. PS03-16]TFV55797.1 VOC family protein [Mycobacterium sp. PS03-16]